MYITNYKVPAQKFINKETFQSGKTFEPLMYIHFLYKGSLNKLPQRSISLVQSIKSSDLRPRSWGFEFHELHYSSWSQCTAQDVVWYQNIWKQNCVSTFNSIRLQEEDSQMMNLFAAFNYTNLKLIPHYKKILHFLFLNL